MSGDFRREIMREEEEGREPGTILLWFGVCITVPSALLFVYIAMTYPITISYGDVETKIICSTWWPFFWTLVGIMTAAIGFIIRRRHRRIALSDSLTDAN